MGQAVTAISLLTLFRVLQLPTSIAVCNLRGKQNNISAWRESTIKMCIANCLDIMQPITLGKGYRTEYCEYNQKTGLASGKQCTKKFYPDERNEKAMICSITSDYSGKHFDFNLLDLIKSRECTHISLAPLVIFNKMTDTLEENMPAIQEWQQAIRSASAFKTKILVDVGSWDDYVMTSESFSKIAASKQLTNKFTNEVKQFLLKYEVDGVLLNWLYPVCPKHACNPGLPQDRSNAVSLLQNLKSALLPLRKTVLLALPPFADALKGYDLVALEPFVDLFPVYSFNYGFHSLPVVMQNTPLADQKRIIEEVWAKLKSYKKIVPGITNFIDYFVLKDKALNKVGSPQLSWKGGSLLFEQGCKRIKNGSYLVVRDPIASNYATLNTEWLTFEDYASLQKKVEHVKQNRMPGMWIKNSIADDFNGECGCGIRPVTRMVAELLRAEGGCNYTPCP